MVGTARSLALLLLLVFTPFSARARPTSAPGWQPGPSIPFEGPYSSGTVGTDGRIYLLTYGFPNLILAAYSPRSGSWSRLPGPFRGHDVLVAVGKTFYGAGGYLDDHMVGSPIETYRIGQDRWTLVGRSICTHQLSSGTLGPDGRIYLIGGGSPNTITTCVEAYDPRTGRWTFLAPLPLRLDTPAVATGRDGRIYVMGGETVASSGLGIVTNRVEAYSPRTNRWTVLAPMSRARGFLDAVSAPDGRIYAIGGSTNYEGAASDARPQQYALRLVEAYSPQTNRWSTVASLREPRFELKAVMGPDGKIYAIGGVSRRTVETYTVPRTTFKCGGMPTCT